MFGMGKSSKMKREIVINAERLETRVAVVENGKLEEFRVEHPTEERIVGSIYKGRIQNLEHDLQAAFVNIGLRKNAFLHYWDMTPDDSISMEIDNGSRHRRRPRRARLKNEDVEKQFPPNSEIIVQVTKGPIGTKGPRVTTTLSVPGRYLVMMPGTTLKGVSRKIGDDRERQRLKKLLARLPVPEGMGVIARTAAAGARKNSLARDLRGLIAIWEEMERAKREQPAPCCLYREPDLVERVVRDWLTEDVDRIIVDNRQEYDRIRDVAGRISRRARNCIQLHEGDLPVFDHYGVEDQIEQAFRRNVPLASGGSLVLDETEALIAIDVNTRRHKGTGSQDEAILAVNTEAVEEVARQLRLRNIGGLVVIDLIDMKSRKHQNSVYRAMKTALKRDRARTNVVPISDLGLMEMTRQRAEESLLSATVVDCPYCRGRGTVKSPLGISVEIQRAISGLMRRFGRSREPAKLQIVVHPTVLDRMRREDEQFLIEIEKECGAELSFRSDPGRHVEFFLISDAATGEVLYSSKTDT
ncbi:MAG: Rne/Rng family ribonuclease [Lentisphaerae bacterium]|nr:Rne/Rng family ribonuclease [Lentisphaerota bacterium]